MTADATTLLRRSPLGATGTADHLIVSAEGIEIVELPFRAQWNLRGAPSPALPGAVEGQLGVRLPATPNRRETGAELGWSAIWLAPDEWLLVGPADASARPSDLESVGGSLVDVSAHRTVLELRGPGTRDVLAAGCSVDLHPRVFQVGHAAQTQLARVDVILSRVAPDTYLVFVRASFATYLADWLGDAVGVIQGGHRA